MRSPNEAASRWTHEKSFVTAGSIEHRTSSRAVAFRAIRCAIPICAFLLFSVFSNAQLESTVQEAPGFKSELSYRDMNQYETVNVFQGNLTACYPLGPNLPVGPDLSMSLTLCYESGWHKEAIAKLSASVDPPSSRTFKDYQAWLKRPTPGFGWHLGMGRIFKYNADTTSYGTQGQMTPQCISSHLVYSVLPEPDGTTDFYLTERWAYEDRMGQVHDLFLTSKDDNANEFATVDGTLLLFRKQTDGSGQTYWTMSMPSGIKVEFRFEVPIERLGANEGRFDILGKKHITNAAVNGFYATKYSDPWGNGFLIEYNPPATTPLWAISLNKISDICDPDRYISFSYALAQPSRTVAPYSIEVQFPGENGERAEYDLEAVTYNLSVGNLSVTTGFLAAVHWPGNEAGFAFEYWDNAHADCATCNPGCLKAIHYPTGATSVYYYASHSYEERCGNHGPICKSGFLGATCQSDLTKDKENAVVRRKVIDGDKAYEWRWERRLNTLNSATSGLRGRGLILETLPDGRQILHDCNLEKRKRYGQEEGTYYYVPLAGGALRKVSDLTALPSDSSQDVYKRVVQKWQRAKLAFATYRVAPPPSRTLPTEYIAGVRSKDWKVWDSTTYFPNQLVNGTQLKLSTQNQGWDGRGHFLAQVTDSNALRKARVVGFRYDNDDTNYYWERLASRTQLDRLASEGFTPSLLPPGTEPPETDMEDDEIDTTVYEGPSAPGTLTYSEYAGGKGFATAFQYSTSDKFNKIAKKIRVNSPPGSFTISKGSRDLYSSNLLSPYTIQGGDYVSSYDYIRNPGDGAAGFVAEVKYGVGATAAEYSVKYDWQSNNATEMYFPYAPSNNQTEWTREIDPLTSRIKAQNDANSELETIFSYDLLGRLTKIEHEVSGSTLEQDEEIQYQRSNRTVYIFPGNSISHSFTTRVVYCKGCLGNLSSPSHMAIYQKYYFDGFGRLTRVDTRTPSGQDSTVETAYGPLGDVIFTSAPFKYEMGTPARKSFAYNVQIDGVMAPMNYSLPVKGESQMVMGTVTSPFDGGNPYQPFGGQIEPLGRPRFIFTFNPDPAAGHGASDEAEIIYSGFNKSVTTCCIEGDGGPITSTTTYYSDALGHLIMVNAPEGADAVYSYNASDDITKVRLSNSASALTDAKYGTYFSYGPDSVITAGQDRIFAYNNIGQKTSATNPEEGATGWAFGAYDALGNIKQYTDPMGRAFTFEYDAKGRKTALKTGSNVLSNWVYDNSDGSVTECGYCKNRLTKTVNYQTVEGQAMTVKEEMKYMGLGGRLSTKKLTVGNLEQMQIDFSYDSMGLPTSDNLSMGNNYYRMDTTYQNGLPLQKLFQDAKGISSIEYCLSMMPKKLAFFGNMGGGVIGCAGKLQFDEEDGRARLKKASLLDTAGVEKWTTGNYTFDGAGNICSIGTNQTFYYDALNRVKGATVKHVTPDAQIYPAYFTYIYDVFGNLTGRSLGASSEPDLLTDPDFRSSVDFANTANAPIANNRLTTYSRNSGTSANYFTNTFDNNGNLTKIKNNAYTMGEMNFTHNLKNQIQVATRQDGGASLWTDKYFYNADGERVGTIRRNSLATFSTSAYMLRDGSKVLGERQFSYHSGVTSKDRRKAYLYLGTNLASTTEWEASFSLAPDPSTFPFSQVTICPSHYVNRLWLASQTEGAQAITSLSDPSLTSRSGRLFDVSYALINITPDIGGAMVRVARLKDQGDSGSSNDGNGNGAAQSDEDQAQCLYFLDPAYSADFVFQRFGLTQNGNYGDILPLTVGQTLPVYFSGLQTDKTYRITLTVWTSLCADPNLGFNRMLLEEGRFTVPQGDPSRNFAIRRHEKTEEDGNSKTVYGCTWEPGQVGGLVGYNLEARGSDGNGIPLNDLPITDTSYEISQADMSSLGVTFESADIKLTGLVVSGADITPVDIFEWENLLPQSVSCGGTSQPSGPPSTPSGLRVDNISTSTSGPRTYLTWNPGPNPGASYLIFRAQIPNKGTCANATTFTQVGQCAASHYTDSQFQSNSKDYWFAYKVKAVIGSQQSGYSECRVTGLGSSLYRSPTNFSVDNRSTGGSIYNRSVYLSWNGSLQTGCSYIIQRALLPNQIGILACGDFQDSDFSTIISTTASSFTDTDGASHFGTALNPLAVYRVGVWHEAAGLMAPYSLCAMTHVSACTTLPPQPSATGSYSSSNNTVTVSWGPVQCPMCSISYRVYSGDFSSGNAVFLSSISGTSVTYPVYDKTAHLEKYSVVAHDENTGCRAAPAVVQISVPVNSGCSIPGPPQNLTGIIDGGYIVKLAWSQSTSANQYNIYRRNASGCASSAEWTLIGQVYGPSYEDVNQAGGLCAYAVTAWAGSGCESPKSSCIEFNIPLALAAPQNLHHPTTPPGDVISLSWDGVSGATAYFIYRAAGGSGGSCQDLPYEMHAASPGPYFSEAIPIGASLGYKVTAVDTWGRESVASACDPVSISEPLAYPGTQSVNSATYFYAWDHLGTNRVTLDELGGIKSTHDYEPYGVEIPPILNLENNRMQFTGHERDTMTGLDYMHARFYAPSLGRFMRPDDGSDQWPESPQSWNLYAYCWNNPVNRTDPDGTVAPLVVAAAAAVEVGWTIYDIIDTYKTVTDESKSGWVRGAALAGLAAGVVTPGSWGRVARGGAEAAEQVLKHSDEAVDAAKGATDLAETAAGKYGHLKDSPSVAEGKTFTQTQKKNILESNKNANQGVLKSDQSGVELTKPSQHTKGVTPPSNEAHVDHVTPKSKGGPNSYNNAQVLSREENLAKKDQLP